MAPIKFGVLMIEYRTLDAAGPLKILSSCSKPLIKTSEDFGLPGTAGLTEKAIDIEFYHINETMDPVQHTAQFKSHPNTTCDTCPDLDYLLIGGPNMPFQLSSRFTTFVQAHVAAGKGLFTTCTGSFAIASTGVLDGKNATANPIAVDFCRQLYPKVNRNEKKQWVVDGNIWTAGGACAGMDMFAVWVLERYDEGVLRVGFQSLDFEPRDVEGKLLVQFL